MKLAQQPICINKDGIFTNDEKGNNFYRGVQLESTGQTHWYFLEAQKYWADIKLNGERLILRDVLVQTAANNTVPYNVLTSVEPAVGRAKDNRFIWYNARFGTPDKNLETGWLCSGGMTSAAEAAECAAAIVAYGLSKDTVCCHNVLRALQQVR